MRAPHVPRSISIAAVVTFVAAVLGLQAPASAQLDCGSEVGCEDPGGTVEASPTVPTTGVTVPTTPTTVGSSVPTTSVPGEGATSTSVAQVSPTTVAAGQTVTIQAGSFAPNQTVQMQLSTTPPTSLGTAQSDASGSVSTTATVPASASPGTYRLTITGPGAQGSPHESAATVTVGLAETGFMSGVLALVGALAIGSGAKLMIQGSWSRPVSTRSWVDNRRRRWPRRT